MAKIHDKYVIELAEVIKGYGNDPDVEDPFELSLFYRFYELPNIAIQRENFLKMKPLEPQRIKGRWETDSYPMDDGEYLMTRCTACGTAYEYGHNENYCGFCGADMRGDEDGNE